MSTRALRLRGYMRTLSENKRLMRVARVLMVAFTAFADSYFIIVIAGIVGAIGISVLPTAINLPQFFGELIAQLCIQNNSCDFTLNMVSLFAAIYILSSFSILLVSFGNFTWVDGVDGDDVVDHLSGKNIARSFSLNEIVVRFDVKREEMQVILDELIDDKKIIRLTATPFANERYMARLHES